MLIVDLNEKQYKFVNSVVKIFSKKKKNVKKIDNFLCIYMTQKRKKKETKKIKSGVINGRNLPFIYNHIN